MYQHLEIFPTPITMVDMVVERQPIIDECLRIESIDDGRVLSNAGGFQSNSIENYDTDVFKPFIRELETHVGEYLKHYKLDYMTVEKSESWFNINRYGNANSPHTHPFAAVAGVYYLQTPEDCGMLVGHNPNQQLIHRDWKMTQFAPEFTGVNSTIWNFQPYEGLLILFPGFLMHHVTPNQNKDDSNPRISISFNYDVVDV